MNKKYFAAFILLIVMFNLLFTNCKDDDDDDLPDTVNINPSIGTVSTSSIDCNGAYTLPSQFAGSDGLEAVGWDLDDLWSPYAWVSDVAGNVGTTLALNWINDKNDDKDSSIRVNPDAIPNIGHCLKNTFQEDSLSLGNNGTSLNKILQTQAGTIQPEVEYNELAKHVYTSPGYDFNVANAAVGAFWGLMGITNTFSGAPSSTGWSDDLKSHLEDITGSYPENMRLDLAKLVLAIGEAYLLKVEALENDSTSNWKSIFDNYINFDFQSTSTYRYNPADLHDDLQIGFNLSTGDNYYTYFLQEHIQSAAQAVSAAADQLAVTVRSIAPFNSTKLDVLTPHGRIVIDTTSTDNVYTAQDLEDVVLLIDFGGNDSYSGRYASTHQFWMSSSILIDVSGNDLYNSSQADITQSATTKEQAFSSDNSFTQGSGLFGVGILIDASGNDAYKASVHSQGSGTYGVGVLADYSGTDSYQVTYLGQGMGYLGVGLLADGANDDSYVIAAAGQGLGRPLGSGAIIDMDGSDSYLALHDDDGSELPNQYNNYFDVPTGDFDDGDGEPHFYSMAQGVGWGFYGRWWSGAYDPTTSWAGGFGALLDFGTDNDQHYADCFSMGTGFVFGFGLLFDEGGNDTYRNFAWSLASAYWMGVGMVIEEDGNDDIYTTSEGGGSSFDYGMSWYLDEGGNDNYGGNFTLGRSTEHGFTFFIEQAGSDSYNPTGDNSFGIVNNVWDGQQKALGMFLDIGGTADTYNTSQTEPDNNTNWYLVPISNAPYASPNPAKQPGIGVDQ